MIYRCQISMCKDVQHHWLLRKYKLKPQWHNTTQQPEWLKLKKTSVEQECGATDTHIALHSTKIVQ